MLRRVVEFEAQSSTPGANVGVDEATKTALLAAISQLRHKLCSEISVVEDLLAAASSPHGLLGAASGALAGPRQLTVTSKYSRPDSSLDVGKSLRCEDYGLLSASSSAVVYSGSSSARPSCGGTVDETSAVTSNCLGDSTGARTEAAAIPYITITSAPSDASGHTHKPSDAVGSMAIASSEVNTAKTSNPCPFQLSEDYEAKRVCSTLTMSDMVVRERAEKYARRKRTMMMSKTLSTGSRSAVQKSIQQSCYRCVNSRHFEAVFAFAILANSVVLAVEVQHRSGHIGDPQPWPFAVAAYVFNTMFFVELVCRILADGLRKYYLRANNRFWAILDTCVVLLSIVESVENVIALMSPDASDNQLANTSSLRIMRMMRIARVLRSFRAFRLIRIMTNLQTLVVSILATLKSLLWATLLIVFVMYVFGVTFTDCAVDGATLITDPADLTYYWGSLDGSMVTLFQAVANGISWREAYECLNEVSILCGWLFLTFISFTYFVLFNVITGVFCNAAIDSAQKNPEIIAQSILADGRANMDSLTRIFRTVDANTTGSITIVEFEALLDDELARAQFTAMGLDIRDAWTIFKLMDADKKGFISESEFVSGIEALKGGARNVDLAALRNELKIANRKVLERLDRVENMAARVAASGNLGDVPSPEFGAAEGMSFCKVSQMEALPSSFSQT